MSKKKVVNKKIERDQLITILRKPSGLVAVINRPKYDFTMSLWDPEKNNCYFELDQFYEFVETPLKDVSASIGSRKNRLLKCWDQLADVKHFDTQILYFCFRILIETQNHPECAESMALPKTSNIHFPVDFRTLLCYAKTRNKVLWDLHSFYLDAIKILKRVGYNAEILSDIYKSTAGSYCDPFWVYHFSQFKNLPHLPERFRINILPLLKGNSIKIVGKWLGLYRELELDRKSNLLASISRLLRVGKEPVVYKWCKHILSSPPSQRTAFTTLIIETKSFQNDPTEIPEKVFCDFFNITNKKQLPGRLFYFLYALQRKISLDYLFAGFRLANRYCPDAHFNNFRDCKHLPYQTVIDFADWTQTRSVHDEAIAIWELCGMLAGFHQLLQNPMWKQIGMRPARTLMQLCIHGVYSFTKSKIEKKTQFTQKLIPSILQLVRDKVPPIYRLKFCKSLYALCRHWFGEEKLLNYLPYCCEVLLRFCVPKFDRVMLNTDVLLAFIKRSGRLWKAFLAAPRSSFLTLEKESTSYNDSFLIERGIRTLLRNAPLFTIKSFQHFPKKLFHVAKTLGAYRLAVRTFIVKDFLETPVMKQNFRRLSLQDSTYVICNQLRPGISNPSPKALTKFLTGEYSLTKARQNRYTKIMFQNLNLTRLELLEKLIFEKSRQHYSAQISDDGLEHAFQLEQLINKNRRQLKRYLHSYLQGHRNYILDHPNTRKWIAAHPNLNFSLWQNGIPFENNHKELGKLCIQIENNPLEILRMGTYVGSCLGLGGGNEFSAAAVMLDINKQVLFARNQDGTVVARQLIALSDDDKLVCFSVYPGKIDNSIKKLFRSYDRMFATELNLSIHLETTGYKIKNILSQDWYDDYAWNLKD